MKHLSWPLRRLVSLLCLSGCVAALPHISIKGSKFYTEDGEQFYLKGVAYQIDPLDTLADTDQCRRDAALMKELGANSIRVYHVKEPVDHSGCMKAFDDAGIYVFLDLDTFSTDIDQYAPHWTGRQARAFEAVMDEFHRYDNTAGFFVGNEVLTVPSQSEVAAFIKAAARDMKAYRDINGYRPIPVGYSHADIQELRPNLQDYLVCGVAGDAESIDFFGLNAYEWCGENTFRDSGYDELTAQIREYPKPIFLSETGCNTAPPRTFEDQRAIFGRFMAPYWSGSIVYEWIQEENHYGLIAYSPDHTDALVPGGGPFLRTGTPLPVTPDFENLKSVWATETARGTPASGYTPQLTPPACPTYQEGQWEVAGDVLLPTLGEKLSQPGVQFSITAGHLPGKPRPTHTTISGLPSTGMDEGEGGNQDGGAAPMSFRYSPTGWIAGSGISTLILGTLGGAAILSLACIL